VGAETVGRITRIADSLGYRPNPIARSLKTAKSGTVGLVIPDLTNPLYPPIVRGVQEVLEAAGYSCLIVSTDNDLSRERTQIEILRSRQVEGFVIATAMLEHPLLAELHTAKVRMVMVNRRPAALDVPSITSDDAVGIEAAVRHLFELGHRRIAHLAGPDSTSIGIVRAQAYRNTIRDLGLDDEPGLLQVCVQWSEAAGAAGMRELLDSEVGFSAVVAANDLIALGCYDVFGERGIVCPDDMSVVGYNDMPFNDKLNPPLTSVAIQHQEIGAEAARTLLDAMAGNERPARSVLLPVSLVVRGSTGPPDS
jgi:LacI family transcriptional regulator